MKVRVYFTRYYTYDVEVDNELEDEEIETAAIEKAEEFKKTCDGFCVYTIRELVTPL